MLYLGNGLAFWKEVISLKYMKSQMQQLIKDNKELHTRLKELKVEHGLEKNNALKALYHSEVADGGKYQLAYQALDQPKK